VAIYERISSAKTPPQPCGAQDGIDLVGRVRSHMTPSTWQANAASSNGAARSGISERHDGFFELAGERVIAEARADPRDDGGLEP
jgi:hypothetical protein